MGDHVDNPGTGGEGGGVAGSITDEDIAIIREALAAEDGETTKEAAQRVLDYREGKKKALSQIKGRVRIQMKAVDCDGRELLIAGDEQRCAAHLRIADMARLLADATKSRWGES